MKCPGCGISLDSAVLSCPNCVAKKSRQALLDHQRQFLPLVATGQMLLKRVALDNRAHYLLFGTSAETYCGRSVTSQRRPTATMLHCDECRKVLAQLEAGVTV